MKRLYPLCALLCATLPAFAFVDSNNNGLSDLWERTYNNGQLYGSSFDPQADADGDGWTNAQEAAAGTNPFDPNPPEGIVRPQLTNIPAVWSEPDENGDSVIVTPASMFMEWQTIPGKQYTLLYSPDLIDWLAVPNETFIGSGSIKGYGVELTDDKLFWRVAVADTDSDSDGLTDAEDYELGVTPGFADANQNQIPDAWEAANAGTFAVYPPVLAARIPINQNSSASVHLFNDTGVAVNYSATLTNNTGPAYSYSNPAFTWEEISTTGTPLATISNADDEAEEVNIGFTFQFYGQDFTTVHVSSNGLLTFGAGSTEFSNTPLPNTDAPPNLIAALWDDLDTRTAGDVYYKQEPNRLIVQYQNVARQNDSNSSYTFQIVLSSDGGIQIRYHTLTNLTDTCTVGTQDSTQQIGLQILSDAPGLTSGMAIDIQPQSAFFSVAPLTGSVPAHSVSVLPAQFQSLTLPSSVYYADLSISHGGAGISPQQITARLEVVNSPGSVELTSPASGQTLSPGTAVTFSANASDPDGIAKVEFYRGTTKIGEATNYPYSISSTTVPDGVHSLTAKLIDMSGAITVSALRTLTILADTDGDGLPDAWETANGLNPNISTGDDGADGDPDGDGLSNFDEWLNGTKPKVADSDGDTVNDGQEVAQGSDPKSASDGGNAPPAAQLLEVPFTVDDPSGSHSERWQMTITGKGPDDHRIISLASPTYGQPAANTFKLRKCNKYEITLSHLGSDPAKLPENNNHPDYDWQAQVDAKPAGYVLGGGITQGDSNRCFMVKDHWLVDNNDGLLGVVDQNFDATDFTYGKKATLIPAGILPDYNRDGKIDQTDQGKATNQTPWRFWNNDDADTGDTGGSDIPHDTQEDYTVTSIRSRRDLIDYFPVRLEIREVLKVLPKEQYSYWLSYDPEHFIGETSIRSPLLKAAWNPEATKESDDFTLKSGAWQRDLAKADVLLGKPLQLVNPYAFGGDGNRIEIPSEMLSAAESGNGLIWISSGLASLTSSAPLELKIKNSNNQVVATISMPLAISGVEEMYRSKFIAEDLGGGYGGNSPGSPPNWPDAGRNGKHFIFVHGYSVSGNAARGWHSEMFKRLFWCGSNAMFTGISWHGNETQILGGPTPDYWCNVHNAFQTSLAVKNFVASLSGVKSIAAHSLGNMVVSSAIADHGLSVANYFMIDAAVALESYSPGASRGLLVPPAWILDPYPEFLWATEWYNLFPAGDHRRDLTWLGRFAAFSNAYNFHSTGEEILKNADGEEPGLLEVAWTGGVRSWAKQEMSKGRDLFSGGGLLHNGNGGWVFNPGWNVIGGNGQYVRRSPAQAALIPAADLKTNPFFAHFANTTLLDANLGSAEAAIYDERARVLSEAMPALTNPAGANPVDLFEPEEPTGESRNINMMTLQNGWPQERGDDQDWKHSDIRELAFLYSYKVYERITELGGLNQ